MISVKIIAVGSLKEPYLRAAVEEYSKRLSAFCRFETVELREARVYDDTSHAAVDAALADEAKRITAAIPAGSFKTALCIEGKSFDSPGLAQIISRASEQCGSICFIIGSSHGLAESVKSSCDLRLSLSELTFPHQLFRVMLMETIYRSFNIIKGTKYHK